MNIKLTGSEPKGSGKFLYVVVSRGSDLYWEKIGEVE
jgi:hypothetical protein